jgi:hypothetical protein
MSVIITVRMSADPAKAAAFAAENVDLIRSISQDGKRQGAIHHRFVAREGEVMVIDEWDSAESFQRFFSGNADIPNVMAASGATGAPEVTVWEPLDMKDEF